MSCVFLLASESVNSISSPSYFTLPSSTSQVARPIVTSEVTDFPHPDSPTSPIIWPCPTFRSTECRASIGPSRVSKWTLRPSISSKFSDTFSPPVLGVYYVPDPVTEQIETEGGDCNRESGEEHQVRVGDEVPPALRYEDAPLRCARGGPESDE